MDPSSYGTHPQAQVQRSNSYHSTHHTPTNGGGGGGGHPNPNTSNNNSTGLSPYLPSPQGQGVTSTANTSPHSIVSLSGAGPGPSAGAGAGAITGTGASGGGGSGPPTTQTNPSPLVPAYLTRFPTQNNHESFNPSSPSHYHRRSVTDDMYRSSGSDRFGPPAQTAWPAVPNVGNGGRDAIKDERNWTPSTGSDRDRIFSNQNYSNSHSHNHSHNHNHNHQDGSTNGNGSGSSNGNITHPPPHQSQSQSQSQPPNAAVFPSAGPTAKRGSKACVACRKGKNRCEWDPTGSETSCRRCLLNGTPCVFEKSQEKGARGRHGSVGQSELGGAEGRVQSLEKTVQTLAQSQDAIQSTLQQILAMLPQSQNAMSVHSFMSGHNDTPTAVPPSSIFPSSVSPPNIFPGSAAGVQGSSQAHSLGGSDSKMHAQADDLMMQFTTQSGTNSGRGLSPQNTAGGGRRRDGSGFPTPKKKLKEFPKLPGFAPPNHQFGTYGVIPLPSAPPSPSRSRHSSRSSSSHSATSSSAIPRETLTAPIQALQALANAADQAAQIAKTSPEHRLADAANGTDDDQDDERDGHGDNGADEGERGRSRKRKRVVIDPKSISLRVKKKKRPDPTPRNPFPDVVTKGLVSEEEARELWDVFFSGCHYFVPLFDKNYDTYDTFIERTPFSTNALLAVAAKIRAGNGPLGQTFHRCLEEAQGIARSTLFGPIVRKEAVIAMLLLSVWSQNGWLPCGHALRMGLDMNLHRALDRLANKEYERSEVEERDLVVSARIWLNCYMHEHLVSLGTGKPLLLRDDSSVQRARDLLSHPMASETDMRLIAGVELVNLRIRIIEHLNPLHGKIDRSTIAFVKRMLSDLSGWYKEWHGIHRQKFEEESVLIRLLETELLYAQLWTVCVALRGSEWDKLAPDQRELAFQAKDAAFRCLEIFLRCENFRKHLKYATHDQLVSVAFAAVFLLKIAMLYPTSVALPHLISQVSQLAHLLSAECFAERYALTLRLMLSNFRRKTGALSTMPGTPRLSGSLTQSQPHSLGPAAEGQSNSLPFAPGNNTSAMSDLDGGLQSLLSLPSMEGFEGVSGDGMNGNGDGGDGTGIWDMGLGGFDWPTEFSPSALPVWLQDGNFADLGLPADGSDSLFLPLELANMFLPSGTQSNAGYQYALPDTGDVGAEAW
ncbi:hypothetical protein IAU59_004083 [Kwoniella sp. CBS 9459]